MRQIAELLWSFLARLPRRRALAVSCVALLSLGMWLAAAMPAHATVTVTLTASSTSPCPGDTVTFTASPSASGCESQPTSYTYAWYVNGSLVTTTSTNTYSLTAASGASYSVYCIVSCTCGTGQSNTVTVSTGTATITISNLSASPNPATKCQNVTLSATASQGCGSFAILYDWILNGTTIATNASSSITVSYSQTAVGTNTYSVRAHNSANTISQTASGTFTVNSVSTTPPTGVSATANGPKSVTVSWGSVSGATSYNVYRIGTTSPIANVTSTSYTDPGATPNSSNCYQVTAINCLGESAKSAQACTSTPACSLTASMNAPTPSSPTTCDTVNFSVTASDTCNNTITVTWDFGEKNPSTGQDYTGTGMTASHKYGAAGTYTVAAVVTSSSGTKNLSTSVTVGAEVLPPAVTNLTATGGTNSVTLSWTGSASSYAVYRQDPANGQYVKIGTTTSTTYTDGNLEPGKSFSYKVAALNGCSDAGPQAGPVSATVSGGTAGNLTVTITPASSTICVGSVTLTASVNSGGCPYTPTYQWYLDGVLISGVTGATCNVPVSEAGSHTVDCFVYQGPCGSGKGTATVTANAPGISLATPTVSPAPATVCDSVTLSASATENCGSGTITYTWHLGVDAQGNPVTKTGQTVHYTFSTPSTQTYVSVTAHDGVNPDVTKTISFNVMDVTAPTAAPTGLAAQAVSPSEIDLTWTGTGNSSYTVYRSTGGGNPTQIAQVATTSYQDTSLQSNQNYCYYVKAAEKCKEGPPSGTACATTQDFGLVANPAELTLAAGGSTTVTITVTPLNGFNGSVYLSPSGTGVGLISPSTTKSTAALAINIPSGTQAGDYTAIVTGSSGLDTHSVTIPIHVTAGPQFNLSLSPTDVRITDGQDATAVVTVIPENSFTGSVSVSASGLPSGASADPVTINVTGGTPASATITFHANFGTGTGGTYPFVLTGTSGSATATTNGMLDVNGGPGGSGGDFEVSSDRTNMTAPVATHGPVDTATITVTPLGNFSGPVTLSCEAPASGLQGLLNWQNSATLTLAQGVPQSTTLEIINSGATVGRYPIVVEGTATIGGAQVVRPVMLWVSVTGSGDYDLAASPTPTSYTVYPGSSTTATITVVPVGSFSDTVSLSTPSAPTHLHVSLSPTSAGPNGTSTLTIAPDAYIDPGNYKVEVDGDTSSLPRHSTTVEVIVPNVDFGLSSQGPANPVMQGQSGTATVTVTPINGFSGTVQLTGAPNDPTTGITVSGGSASPGSPGTLTVTVPSTLLTGTYPVTVTGTWGNKSHTCTFNVTVSCAVVWQPGSPINLQITTPTTATVAPGSTVTINATASDTDLESTDGGNTFSPVPDTCTIAWSGDAVSGNPTGNSYTWTAPSTPGTYTITATATDAQDANKPSYQCGTRRDAPVSQSVTLTVASSAGDFDIAASPTTLMTQPGGTVSSQLTLTPNGGFYSNVTLTATGLPQGVTGNFVSLDTGASGSTLTVNLYTVANVVFQASVDGSVQPNSYPITIDASGGGQDHQAALMLDVSDFSLTATPPQRIIPGGSSSTFTVTASPLYGFTGDVNLTCGVTQIGPGGGGSTSGISVGFSPGLTPSTTVTVNGGPASATVTVNVAQGMAEGTYTLMLSGTSGTESHVAMASIIVPPSDFTISADPSELTVPQGQATNAAIDVTRMNGFAGPVAIAYTASDSSGTDVTSTLAVQFLDPVAGTYGPSVTLDSTHNTTQMLVTAGVPAGDYTIVVTGTANGHTRIVRIKLHVTGADFDIEGAPAEFTGTPTDGADTEVMVTPVNGYTGDVSLSITNATDSDGNQVAALMPTDPTVFDPNPVSITDENEQYSDLWLDTTGVANGVYNLQVIGTSGSLVHKTNLTLNVTDQPTFDLWIDPSTLNEAAGDSDYAGVFVFPYYGFTGDVILKIGALWRILWVTVKI